MRNGSGGRVRRSATAGVASVACIVGLAALAPAQQADGEPQCSPAGSIVRVPELTEASGLAASRRTAGRFWAHNDSGEPVLVALDTHGSVDGRISIDGAVVEDWEALAVGTCPSGSCIYIGDIGDNDAERDRITIYRIPEPDDGVRIAKAETFHATYPDGPQDAEALLVAKDGRAYVVTKGETGPVALYAFPRNMQPGASVRLEKIGKPHGSGSSGDRITDGAVSPDGQWVVLRTLRALVFYRASEFLQGLWREAGRVDLKQLDEPQGEGVAFSADGEIYLAGEGGAGQQPGTFARLTCSRGGW